MKENFSGDVYNAYLKLPIAVMKADLFRYCVVYHYVAYHVAYHSYHVYL